MRFLLLSLLLLIQTGCANIHPLHEHIVQDDHNIYNVALKHTVLIEIPSTQSKGSGVVIEEGVLTAAHLFQDYKAGDEIQIYSFSVMNKDGIFQTTAKLIRLNFEKDIALLILKNDKVLKPIKIVDRFPKMYSEVLTAGFPTDQIFITKGRYFGPAADNLGFDIVSSPIYYGNSGGPSMVYNHETEEYELIGLVSSMKVIGMTIATHIARIVNIQTIHEFLEE